MFAFAVVVALASWSGILWSSLAHADSGALAQTRTDAPSAEENPGEASRNLFGRIRKSVPKIQRSLKLAVASVDDLPVMPETIWTKLRADGAVGAPQLLGAFVAAILFGIAAELFLRRAVRTVVARSEAESGAPWRARLGLLMLRAVTEIFTVVAFAAGALAAMLVIDLDSEHFNLLFISIVWLIVAIRMVAIGSRVVLAPRSPGLRLLPIDNATALTAHRHVIGIGTLILIMWEFPEVMRDFQLSAGLRELVGIILSAIFVLAVIGLILRWRRRVAAMMLGDRSDDVSAVDPLKRKFVESCHVLAIAYVVGIWLIAMGVRFATGESVFVQGIVSLLVVAAIPFLDLGLRAIAHRSFGAGDDELASQPENAKSNSPRSYENVALRNMRILLAIFLVMAIAETWRIDLSSVVEGIVGTKFAKVLLDVGITLVLAYALWSVVKTAVRRHVGARSEGGPPGSDGEGGGAGATRLQTLLPLVQKFLLVTLIAIVTMVALSSAGVAIGPLLAGAGMVGIAIGFGAQTLVRDIVSGLFFLIDDAFRMGEYVEIENTRGTVEKISIRSMQLRHHNGPVHTVPFGEIRQLTNYSRDWHIMKFELRLPFETDINRVRKIIKKVGEEMMEEPELGPMMLGPLKSQGVNRMDDSALIIRCKVTCVPGQQFMVRREAYTRIKKAFEANDIHFAPRRVIVEATTPAQAVQAAADILDIEDKGGKKSVDDRG